MDRTYTTFTMFHLGITWFFFKQKLLVFCKFLKNISSKRISAAPHSRCEFLQQSTFHRRTNIIPLLIVLLSVEILPILKTAVFQTFLPTSNSEFSAALGHKLDLFGLPVMEKYFDIINFFKRSNFSQCLCHVVFRVSFKGR